MTATQKTALKSFAHRYIRPMALSGPRKAPTGRPEGGAPEMRRCDVRDQRIAGGAANALADSVRETRRQNGSYAERQCEEWLGYRAKRIASTASPLRLPR